MQRLTASPLGDLLAATEAVGDDQPVRRGLAYRRQQFQFTDRHGDVVLVVLEAEGTGHSAAAGSRRLKIDSYAVQKRLFGGHPHDRLVMAVSVQQGLAFKAGQGRIAGLAVEKFDKQERVPGARLRPFVVREKV